MSQPGTLTSITYRPQEGLPHPASHFQRLPLDSARLVAGYGIEGDAKGGHPKRQINIMGAATLERLREVGFKTGPGEMGEQMIVAGLDIDALPVGARLRLGASVTVEVTSARTGCSRFEAIQGQPRSSAQYQMGVLVRVVEGGLVRLGDPVTVLAGVTDAPAVHP